MNILETAVRRILVRTVDNTISTVGRNAAYNATDYNPDLPSSGKLVTNVIFFAILTYVISLILLFFNFQFLAYCAPLMFVGRIFRPLFTKYIYGKKQVAFTVSDRRFKSGRRTEGYRIVKDENNKIEFTDEQIKTSRLEALLKIILLAFVILNVFLSVNSDEYRLENLSENQVLDLLKVGDSVFAKLDSTEIFIKTKETIYRTGHRNKKEISYESVNYISAFYENKKKLGYFIKLETDSLKNNYRSKEQYIMINYKNLNKWEYKNLANNNDKETEIKRLDTLFYVKLSDITVSIKKLPK